MIFANYFEKMAQLNVADVILVPGFPAYFKCTEGFISDEPILTKQDCQQLVQVLLNEKQQEDFFNYQNQSVTVTFPQYGRYSCDVFWQQQAIAIRLRHINREIPKLSQLAVPLEAKQQFKQVSGLVLIAGPQHSGRAATLASVVDYRRSKMDGFILSLEDPIKFQHKKGGTLLIQREIGSDVSSFDEGLRSAWSHSPDVVVVSDIRDGETLNHVLQMANSGHLVVAGIHGNSALTVIKNIISMKSAQESSQTLSQLSEALRMLLVQRLVPTKQENKPALIFEMLINSPLIKELISQCKFEELQKVMEKEDDVECLTFDGGLKELFKRDVIDEPTFIDHSQSKRDAKLYLKTQSGKLTSKANEPSWLNLGLEE